ncbi:hypothetical protein [Shimia abyssi]|uniref:Alpha/beta hydrolase family protein n=1 Tax=Shimia abyssi TaxID=1662395 RepID=A0A2P8FCK9_9RHOB|nr:hypothetical protein [Shimia abyssi]PSL19449.1 hypothetical protein CLV88_106162 [Shimia abyssi]
MGKNGQISVKRRRVFYIPGYDPIHPRRYRELYRKEGAAQAEISGYDIALAAKKPGSGPYGWHVNAAIDGTETEVDVEVLFWSDIVRSSMEQSIFATYMQLARTAWIYIGSGSMARLMRLRKGPVIAALYPLFFMVGTLALALLLAWWIAKAVALFLPAWMGLIGLAVVPAILMWIRKKDNVFYAYYLLHDYAYQAAFKGTYHPELEARLAEFGERVAAALEDDVDEVLLVGHSCGAHLAVSILSDLIRDGRVPEGRPALSLLSLGQVVPMVTFLPEAYRLRSDLAFLSTRQEVTWVDVTAPGDGCAFALCDPVSVSVKEPEGKRWPLVISAAFTKTLSPERWAELRWRFFRLHFQYLCAFDRPGDYDYFRITAGSQTLGERFSGRSASKSRIEKTVNKFSELSP